MKKAAKDAYAKLMAMYGDYVEHHNELVKLMHEEGHITELADLAYVLRQLDDMIHDMHKKSASTYELAGRLLCLMWAKNGSDEPVRTPYCTITPKIKMAANLPKRGSDEYIALLTSMGFTAEMLETDAVRPHWPGLTDFITQRLTEGRALPAGLNQASTYPVYGITILKKKGITE
jgi:hypothetical protein